METVELSGNPVDKVELPAQLTPRYTASNKTIMVIAFATILIISSGIILSIYWQSLISAIRRATAPPPVEANSSYRAQEPVVIDLGTLIVNLKDPHQLRHLKITISFSLDNPEDQASVLATIPRLRDGVMLLLSEKTIESLQAYDGKVQLRDEVTQRLNSLIVHGLIRTVYFREFVAI